MTNLPFGRAFFISVLFIGASVFLDGNLKTFCSALGLLPIFFYYRHLLTQKDISNDQIDSVYYLGFLITIAALIVSALDLSWSSRETNLKSILIQFGIGLIATAGALYARIDLISRSALKPENDAAESAERLANSVRDTAIQFDQASQAATQFVTIARTRMQHLQESILESEGRMVGIFEASGADYRERLRRASEAFTVELDRSRQEIHASGLKSIKESTEQFSLVVSELVSEIARIHAEASGVKFTTLVSKLEILSSSLTGSLTSVSQSASVAAQEASSAIGELTTASRRVISLVGKISTNLESLEAVEKFTKSAFDAQRSLDGIAKEAESTAGAVNALATALGQINGHLNTGVITSTADNLASEMLDSARQIKRINKSVGELLTSFKDTASMLDGTSKVSQRLIVQMETSMVENPTTSRQTAIKDSLPETSSVATPSFSPNTTQPINPVISTVTRV